MNAVEIDAVTHRYGAMTALQDLHLRLSEGEVLGLFGHNGAGKTTTMKLVLGLLEPSAGTVRVIGRDPRASDVRRQLGYLPENVTFYPQLSGRETLRHFARLKGTPLEQVDDLLEQVGLAHAMHRRVKTYSKGMRQRLGLAQAVLGVPRVLLLDEPTVGLDPIATQDLYSLIDRLRQGGTSVILCSHVLPGVETHIDRAAIVARGRLQAIGSLGQLRGEARLPVRIRANGTGRSERALRQLIAAGHAARPHADHGIEVIASDDRKVSILRELLADRELLDVEIQQPSLEDLYRYHMERAGDVRVREGRP